MTTGFDTVPIALPWPSINCAWTGYATL
jgi:hypothetical protein